MRDHDDQMRGSSPQDSHAQPVANGAGDHGAAAPPRSEPGNISRHWGGAGIPVHITLTGHEARNLDDLRVLWGYPHGGDGYSLLPFELTAGHHSAMISVTIPDHALPGVYAVQLQHGNQFLHRYQFVVTTHEPPETSPFRTLRSEPANGTLRMYLTYDRWRDVPPRAAAEIAKLLKGYDTFFAPPEHDPSFQEILDESLTQDEKREKFAKWLVKNQLAAEEAA
jgi:hypothetical protein